MADVQPFRATRYDLGRVGDLSAVVAPPYDVIDARLQQQLHDRSEHNVVRVDLSRDEPGDTDANNRYTRAAATLRGWQLDGILTQDSARGVYAYEQTFEVEGQTHTRRGFLARVRLEKFGEGRIYPHEETLSGPKADRLHLTRATAMNLSPIFGLYPDESNEVYALLEEHTRKTLPLEARDHLGVVSRLWPITDQSVLSKITGLMGPKPVFIADGHHRYETGLRYAEERREGGETNPDHPSNYILMMLVGMSDPGLVILPTHRLLSGGAVAGLTMPALLEKLGTDFAVESTPADAQEAWATIEADGTQTLLGFGTVADGKWVLARFNNPETMAKLAAEHSDTWRGLGVAVLQRLIVEQKLAGEKPKFQYVHLVREVEEVCAAKGCDLAVLVPPATMSHVEEIAGNWEKMPPKSTYFYPKLLTGLVFHSLRSN